MQEILLNDEMCYRAGAMAGFSKPGDTMKNVGIVIVCLLIFACVLWFLKGSQPSSNEPSPNFGLTEAALANMLSNYVCINDIKINRIYDTYITVRPMGFRDERRDLQRVEFDFSTIHLAYYLKKSDIPSDIIPVISDSLSNYMFPVTARMSGTSNETGNVVRILPVKKCYIFVVESYGTMGTYFSSWAKNRWTVYPINGEPVSNMTSRVFPLNQNERDIIGVGGIGIGVAQELGVVTSSGGKPIIDFQSFERLVKTIYYKNRYTYPYGYTKARTRL